MSTAMHFGGAIISMILLAPIVVQAQQNPGSLRDSINVYNPYDPAMPNAIEIYSPLVKKTGSDRKGNAIYQLPGGMSCIVADRKQLERMPNALLHQKPQR